MNFIQTFSVVGGEGKLIDLQSAINAWVQENKFKVLNVSIAVTPYGPGIAFTFYYVATVLYAF